MTRRPAVPPPLRGLAAAVGPAAAPAAARRMPGPAARAQAPRGCRSACRPWAPPRPLLACLTCRSACCPAAAGLGVGLAGAARTADGQRARAAAVVMGRRAAPGRASGRALLAACRPRSLAPALLVVVVGALRGWGAPRRSGGLRGLAAAGASKASQSFKGSPPLYSPAAAANSAQPRSPPCPMPHPANAAALPQPPLHAAPCSSRRAACSRRCGGARAARPWAWRGGQRGHRHRAARDVRVRAWVVRGLARSASLPCNMSAGAWRA